MVIRYERRDYKTLLLKHKYIDSWFWCRYGINSYQGCEHACTYCDSRSHKYHLHSDFDHIIYIKNNAAEMLDRRIGRARTLLPDVVVMSGGGDPYQPCEIQFENTRQCLEILRKHRYPVHVITKSALVVRDLDILTRIAENNWCAVSFTITTTNEDLSGYLESGAPTPKERLEALSVIKQTGKILTGVTFMPIVPYLCDDESNLESVIRSAKEAGADYILFAGGMTMRDNQAMWFLRKLEDKCPDLIGKYLDLYDAEIAGNAYVGRYGPSRGYTIGVNRKMLSLCEKYELPYRMPRFIPRDYRKENYIISEYILNEAYYLQARGRSASALFWAGQNITNLRESVRGVASRGELKKIRNIDASMERRIIERLGEMDRDPIKEKGKFF